MDYKKQIKTVQKLYESNVPILGIALGHQLMAIANGAKTEKLKYGHRGPNHPVKDLKLDKVHITSQNHGYHVSEDSIDKKKPSPTVQHSIRKNPPRRAGRGTIEDGGGV